MLFYRYGTGTGGIVFLLLRVWYRITQNIFSLSIVVDRPFQLLCTVVRQTFFSFLFPFRRSIQEYIILLPNNIISSVYGIIKGNVPYHVQYRSIKIYLSSSISLKVGLEVYLSISISLKVGKSYTTDYACTICF